MSLLKWLAGGDTIGSIERVAKEWIETKKETTEAAVVMIKALDPNGKMRRKISTRVTNLYTLYIITMVILILMRSFGVGDAQGTSEAISELTSLFIPITTLFGSIVSASFGVNAINTHKDK